MNQDNVRTDELRSGRGILRRVAAEMRHTLEVQVLHGSARRTFARGVGGHLIEPNTKSGVAGFDDIDEPLGILYSDVRREDKHGIAFEFDEAERSRQFFNEKVGELCQNPVRVRQLVVRQKSGVTRNIGN